jgi:D-arginine dehydrogenase
VPILRREHAAHVLLEEHAQDIDVHALHRGFLRGLKRRGGTLMLGDRVESIARNGAGWEVVAGEQAYHASVVVNAAGAWADDVAAMAGLPRIGLEPRRRTAMILDLPDGIDPRAWPMVMDAAESFYFKPDAGRLLLSLADETPSPPVDAMPDDMDVAVAIDRFERATTLTIDRVQSSWAGLRTFARDRTPVVGFEPSAPGFFWLAGQGGYGIQTAPALSRVAAALALGDALPEDIADHGVDVAGLAPRRLR